MIFVRIRANLERCEICNELSGYINRRELLDWLRYCQFEWMDGWMDGWTDGRTDGRMDR
jgi:hypothetical protein